MLTRQGPTPIWDQVDVERRPRLNAAQLAVLEAEVAVLSVLDAR